MLIVNAHDMAVLVVARRDTMRLVPLVARRLAVARVITIIWYCYALADGFPHLERSVLPRENANIVLVGVSGRREWIPSSSIDATIEGHDCNFSLPR